MPTHPQLPHVTEKRLMGRTRPACLSRAIPSHRLPSADPGTRSACQENVPWGLGLANVFCISTILLKNAPYYQCRQPLSVNSPDGRHFEFWCQYKNTRGRSAKRWEFFVFVLYLIVCRASEVASQTLLHNRRKVGFLNTGGRPHFSSEWQVSLVVYARHGSIEWATCLGGCCRSFSSGP